LAEDASMQDDANPAALVAINPDDFTLVPLIVIGWLETSHGCSCHSVLASDLDGPDGSV
jgi:hypothetical protein